MKINRIALRGLTTYKEEAVLDLAALGPGLIAIAGPNGGGKTTLLEAVPGAVYRQTPSRGSIATLATSREAMVEISGENGVPFAVRLDIDNHSGKQEAMIYDGAGEPLAGPKVRDFDAYVAGHFPALDVYLASMFASQTGVGSVLKMARSDRRALFGRLLGLERLDLMATAARERARGKETEIAAAQAALEAVRSGAEDVADLEKTLRAAEGEAAKAEIDARAAEKKYRAAVEERDRLEAAAEEARRVAAWADEAAEKARDAGDRVAGLEVKLKSFEGILAVAPEIRKLAARILDLASKMDEVRQSGETAAAEERQAGEAVDLRRRELDAAEREDEDVKREVADAKVRARQAAEAKTRALNSTAAVPCAGALEDSVRAACPALVGHFRTRDEASKTLAEFETDGERLGSKLATAAALREKTGGEWETGRKAKAEAFARADRLRAEYGGLRTEIEKLRGKDRSAALDKAEVEAAALGPALMLAREAAREAEEEAKRALEASRSAGEVDEKARAASEAADVAELDLENVRNAAREARAQAVRLEEKLKAAREAHEKAKAIVERIAPMEADLGTWRWLGRGLGREGVQALELDAAGPRVSELANELLAAAFGSRFAVRFETQAAKADGKGVKETFDVIVVDTERGREGNGEDLSGGEKVIVGEALGMAVGLFHGQAAGVKLGTICRDETIGALDPENGERYISMLRHFLRIGLVHQLLFVCHNPDLISLADAVVEVTEGRIHVH